MLNDIQYQVRFTFPDGKVITSDRKFRSIAEADDAGFLVSMRGIIYKNTVIRYEVVPSFPKVTLCA